MDEITLTKNLKNTAIGIALAAILTTLSYVVASLAGWVNLSEINFLEAFAVFTSYVCTWLCVHQTRWNYPIGIVTTFAYSILFWQFELFALSIFNMYLVFSLAYGYWRWDEDEFTIPVTWSKPLDYIIYVAFGLLVYGLLWVIHTTLGQDMTWQDTALAVLSGVAQLLLDQKKIESWMIWIFVNIGSIIVFFDNGLYISMFQYVFFLANAFFGAYMWWKSMNKNDDYEEAFSELTFPDFPRIPKKIAVFD